MTIPTVVFAVYVAGLVGALLTVGSHSDHLGRRPVLVASLLVAAAGTAIFWVAGGVVSLVLAQVVQGIATESAIERETGTQAGAGPDVERNRRALLREPTYEPHWDRWAAQEDTFIARYESRSVADWIVDETSGGLVWTRRAVGPC